MNLPLAVLGTSAGLLAFLLGQLRKRNRELLRTSTLLTRTGDLQAFVAHVNQAAALLDDEAAFLDTACTLAIREGKLALAIIGRPSDPDGRFVFPAAAGETRYLEGLEISARPDVPEGQGTAGRAWREDQAFFNTDFQVDFLAPWRARAVALGLMASATLPIHRGGKTWAILLLYRGDDIAFDPPMQRLLRQVADDIGHGLDHIARNRQLKNAQGVYQALVAAGDSLLQSTTEAAMIARLCQSLIDGTEFSAVWLARPDDRGVFRALGRSGERMADREFIDGLCITTENPDMAVAAAWRTQAVAIGEIDAPARSESDGTAPAPRQSAAILAAPVRRAGTIWGVLALIGKRAELFDAVTRSACERVAALLGHGLDELDRKADLQTLQDTESRRARTDPLTDLPNRLALGEYLPTALARAERRQTIVAVGMLDIDDFKPVNDHFGHAAGDVLLQKLAQALRARVRQTSFLARLGGDEFVIVFEDLEPDQVLGQLETALNRLHAAVEAPFDLGNGHSAQVGMTMGVALYPHDAAEADTLLRMADAAMYACKVRKLDRIRWWCLDTAGTSSTQERSRELILDVFGRESSVLLASLDAEVFDPVARGFAAAFYEELSQDPDQAPILRCLTEEELQRLKRAQAEHLLFLLQPDTTRQAIEDKARGLGRIHALVGVASASMERAFAQYEALLRGQLEASLISSRERYLIMRVATARLRLDVQIQLLAMDQTLAHYFAILKDPIKANARWVDALPITLDTLSDLPGIRHAMVFRPDETGTLRIETGTGADFPLLWDALHDPDLSPDLNVGLGLERGPMSMAWFTREVQVVDACLLDPRLANWHAMARRFHWRSAATIPIAGTNDTDSVLVLFGEYTHQFSSGWARSWLELLRNRLATLFSTTARGHRPIDRQRVRALRDLLYGRGLNMWVQPIVDLQTGAVPRVEALARLHDPNGGVFSPEKFLPAFGEQEIHALFRHGMHQALDLAHGWREAGLEVDISVNLPPVTLSHPDCVFWVAEALRSAQIAPRHLTLEILESAELDHARSGEAMQAIDALGVRLALDDLGSGYNSLARLASLPIDTVKIDQALIRELPRDPIKTVRLLATLIHVGREFVRKTVVEGLEDEGFVEVARLLGARHGQGFALARPMPAEEFPAWIRSHSATAGGTALRTWPGALAYHWVAGHDRVRAQQTRKDFATCPLSEFLRTQGVETPEVLHWHETAHIGATSPERKEASEALLRWLGQQVSLAYVPQTPSAPRGERDGRQ